MTIHAPTYPGPVDTLVTPTCPDFAAFLTAAVREPWADPPAVVDDSPAALIARLTAGDVCDNCGAAGRDLRSSSYSRGRYDDKMMCEECHSQARMED